MVVRTQHINGKCVVAVELVRNVGDVAGDVCRVAVGLDHHTVLVVAKVRGAQPPRVVSLIQVAVFLQGGNRLIHRTRFEQRVLVEVHVEVHAEIVQRLLNLREHHLHASSAEGLLHFSISAFESIGLLFDDRLSDLANIIAPVTILRGWIPLGSSNQRTREAVDLATVVVEVVLAGHLRARSLKHAAQRVTHRSPAGTAEVNRAGRVRRDEFQVHLLAGVDVGVAKRGTLLEHLGYQLALGVCGEAQVNKAGPCDLSGGDGRVLCQDLCKPACEFARVRARLLRHLQCNVGGVVAVLRIARALHSHGVGDNRGVEIMVCKHALCGGFYGGGKFCWRHGHAV